MKVPTSSTTCARCSRARTLRRYTPQRDFLALLNIGDGTALGTKWGRSFEGRWVMRLKDWIDRRFMRRFQVSRRRASRRPTSRRWTNGMEMLCGGCAAKVGQSVLDRALARVAADAGAPQPTPPCSRTRYADDAAAVRTPRGDILTSTVDVFSAFTEDPWLVGKVAAVNAMSDLLATGVAPRYALALVAVPEASDGDEAEEILYQVLAGARAASRPARRDAARRSHHDRGEAHGRFLDRRVRATTSGACCGSIGFARDRSWCLTKALGTGVVFHADMRALARGPWLEAALRSATAAATRRALEACAPPASRRRPT